MTCVLSCDRDQLSGLTDHLIIEIGSPGQNWELMMTMHATLPCDNLTIISMHTLVTSICRLIGAEHHAGVWSPGPWSCSQVLRPGLLIFRVCFNKQARTAPHCPTSSLSGSQSLCTPSQPVWSEAGINNYSKWVLASVSRAVLSVYLPSHTTLGSARDPAMLDYSSQCVCGGKEN